MDDAYDRGLLAGQIGRVADEMVAMRKERERWDAESRARIAASTASSSSRRSPAVALVVFWLAIVLVVVVLQLRDLEFSVGALRDQVIDVHCRTRPPADVVEGDGP